MFCDKGIFIVSIDVELEYAYGKNNGEDDTEK